VRTIRGMIRPPVAPVHTEEGRCRHACRRAGDHCVADVRAHGVAALLAGNQLLIASSFSGSGARPCAQMWLCLLLEPASRLRRHNAFTAGNHSSGQRWLRQAVGALYPMSTIARVYAQRSGRRTQLLLLDGGSSCFPLCDGRVLHRSGRLTLVQSCTQAVSVVDALILSHHAPR
jgi:hypothetical protein